MGGPVLEVLLWEPIAGDRARVLQDLIASVTDFTSPDNPQVATTRPIGGSFDGNFDGYPSLPITIKAKGVDEESHDPAGVEAAFGRIPHDSVVVCAFTSGRDSHRALAEIGLAIAERLGGVIDFCGLLAPFRGLSDSRSWDEVQADAADHLAGLPGKVVVIPYETADGGIWGGHVGDATFLRAWLGHPNFRMIK